MVRAVSRRARSSPGRLWRGSDARIAIAPGTRNAFSGLRARAALKGGARGPGEASAGARFPPSPDRPITPASSGPDSHLTREKAARSKGRAAFAFWGILTPHEATRPEAPPSFEALLARRDGNGDPRPLLRDRGTPERREVDVSQPPHGEADLDRREDGRDDARPRLGDPRAAERRRVELCDMGGLGGADDAFDRDVDRQIKAAMSLADAVIFVVDARDGVIPLDRDIANRILRLGKPIVLVANKAETRELESLAASSTSSAPASPSRSRRARAPPARSSSSGSTRRSRRSSPPTRRRRPPRSRRARGRPAPRSRRTSSASP